MAADGPTCDDAGSCTVVTKAPGKLEAAPGYFAAYGTAFVQAEMLQDEVRTSAYRDAILGNRWAFEGKVVLDVGAGTGILSFFAAQAGAARVFAVERSDMAFVARRIAAANGLEGTVEVLHGLLEEVELPVKQVDVIISEWLGTFLIHESMLDSVIFARDKWLAPSGVLLPDRATLYLAGIENQGVDLDSWKDFHGLDFSALGHASRQVAAQQCAIRRSLATLPATLMDLDLYRVTVQDVDFTVPFHMSALGHEATEVQALVGWFTTGFFNVSRGNDMANVSELTTHPDAECTHWQQTFFFLSKELPLGGGEALDGVIGVSKSIHSPRDISVNITLGGHVEESYVIVGAEC